MTHDTPPKRIWMTHEDHGASWSGAYRAFRCSDLDHSNDDGPNPEYPEYILASEAEAMVAAALREAMSVAARHRSTIEINEPLWHEGQDWASYRIGEAILDLIPQPASAALDKLIAEAVNNAMLQCVCLVAEVRNAQQPGPIFAALNEAMGRIENARFTAIREAKGAKP